MPQSHSRRAGNSPKLMRRDADLPPSDVDPDAPPNNNISECNNLTRVILWDSVYHCTL